MVRYDLSTFIRGMIAAIVIFVSYRLAVAQGDKLTPEWEAVLLVVIGYYFKDRPREDEMIALRGNRGEASIRVDWEVQSRNVYLEMITQFVLALTLVGFTVAAFLESQQTAISGAWIGAVVLAVGFYFKDTHSAVHHRLHELLRTALAATVAAFTLIFVSDFAFSPGEVPLQWVGIVFIVVAFYFKERNEPSIYRLEPPSEAIPRSREQVDL